MTPKQDAAKEILIVEDSEIQIELLKRVLASRGYKVSIARNGAEALAEALEHKPDLIISDIMMPVMDGYQLCQELKKIDKLKNIPLILLTQLSDPEEVIKGLEAGADNYLTKPFEPEYLLMKINSLLISPIKFVNNPKEKCMEFTITGKRYVVKSSRAQTLNFLISTYENVVRRNLELYKTQEELERTNEQLEEKVRQRTAILANEMAERKQLSVDLLKRNRELSALYAIYKASAEKPLLHEMLDATLTTVLDVLEMDVGTIYLLDTEKKKLVLSSQAGIPEEKLEPFITLEVGDGVAGAAATEMKPVIKEFKDYPTKRLAGRIASIGLQSMVGIPIISGNDLLGSMSFGNKITRVFYKDDLDMLSAIGRQIGAMIHTSRLYGQLKESEEKFQSMASAASDAVISIDGNGVIKYWNPAAERILGYQSNDMMGRGIGTIIPDKYSENYRNGLKQFYETGFGNILGKSVEVTALRKDGVEIPVELAVSGFRLGGAWHSVGIMRDITERKQWETSLKKTNLQLQESLEELKKSQNMLIRNEKLAALGQLSAGVAHEIKNPLNIISTSVQLLMLDENLAPETGDIYKTIMEQIARAVKITENLRDFARQRRPEIAEIDINPFLDKTIALVEYEFRLDNINFIRDFYPAPIIVKGDKDQLAQVFLNFINNGADSMKEKQLRVGREKLRKEGWKGDLTIKTTHDKSWVYISFIDTGNGMSHEVRKRAFDPFFTTKEEGKGTGLGLSIAMGIIENHGGAILLETAEGKGCDFTIKLPFDETERQDEKQ